VVLVMDAIVTGFFLGAAWIQYLRGHDALTPLVMAGLIGLIGVGTLRGMFVALRNCPPPTKTPQNEVSPHTASA